MTAPISDLSAIRAERDDLRRRLDRASMHTDIIVSMLVAIDGDLADEDARNKVLRASAALFRSKVRDLRKELAVEPDKHALALNAYNAAKARGLQGEGVNPRLLLRLVTRDEEREANERLVEDLTPDPDAEPPLGVA